MAGAKPGAYRTNSAGREDKKLRLKKPNNSKQIIRITTGLYADFGAANKGMLFAAKTPGNQAIQSLIQK